VTGQAIIGLDLVGAQEYDKAYGWVWMDSLQGFETGTGIGIGVHNNEWVFFCLSLGRQLTALLPLFPFVLLSLDWV